ncbi:MAG TPA: serine hydrolase domain-containing protein [Candidatus Cybelea sp.]|jgi:D-alanyl-D-alanine carboxypeptidase|nr:serine hydrolase domain-containing protein [Candidatus Cybelea sp.]
MQTFARLLLGVALASAGGAAARASTPSTPASRAALKPISQAALRTMVDATARELRVPGAVVLLRTPQGEFSITYGTTQLGTTRRPTAGTYFRIASNTKSMTAALIVQLAQEGKLKFSDPVSKYVAGVPNGDHITIAELLNMRSGLYNYLDAPVVAATADRDMTKVWTPTELLAIAFAHKPNFAPGASYEYNNTNYILLGLIIEKIGVVRLAETMRVRLFEPLGLRHTELPPSNVTALPKPYSHGYMYGSSSVAFTGTPPYSPAVKAAARAGRLLPTDYTNLNTTFGWAAGGAVSNASDLATWIEALVSGRVFDARYQQRWIDSLRPEDPKKPDGQVYGYGIALLRWGKNSMYFHGGETAGYNSFMGYDPANKVTLVVWTNLTVSLDELPTANALMLKVLDQIYVVSPLKPTLSP